MNSAARAKRPSSHLEKKEVIVIGDNSDGDQPAVKSAKWKEESIPSPEVIELQQQVATLQQKLDRTQDNFESSFRIAREWELRAKQAEQQLLDSTRDAKSAGELHSKLTEVTAQLHKSMRAETLTYHNNRELARENEVLSADVADLQRMIGQSTTECLELQDKIFEMTSQIAQYQQWEQWARQNELFRLEKPAAAAGRPELQQIHEEVAGVQQLQQEQQQLDPRLRRHARVKQQQNPTAAETMQQPQMHHQQLQQHQLCDPRLQQKPAVTVQQLQQQQQTMHHHQQQQQLDPRLYRRAEAGKDQHIDQKLKPMEAPPAPSPLSPEKSVKIYDIEHPTNILQLFRAGALKSVGLDSAVSKLKTLANECGEEKLRLYLSQCEDMTFHCEVCEFKINKFKVLRHFFSLGHIEKVRAHGAAVALAAYQYWLRLLQQAATAPAAPAPAAAAHLTLAAPAEQQVAAAVPVDQSVAGEVEAPASQNWDEGSFIVIKEEDEC